MLKVFLTCFRVSIALRKSPQLLGRWDWVNTTREKKKKDKKRERNKLLSPAAEKTSHKLGVEACSLSPFGLGD